MKKLNNLFLLSVMTFLSINAYAIVRCSKCGKAIFQGDVSHFCRAKGGWEAGGAPFSRNFLIHSNSTEPVMSYGCRPEKLGVQIPCSSNLEFPQFGRWIDRMGNVTPYNNYCFLRPVRERYADYFHRCLKRAPLRVVSENDMRNWMVSRIKKKNLASLRRIAQGDVIATMNELERWENLLCGIEAECYRYGMKSDARECIKAINNLYDPKNYYKWENLLFRNIKGRRTFFNEVFRKIEQYIHDTMDRLDAIHAEEFIAWKNDPENQIELMDRRAQVNHKKQEQLIMGLNTRVVNAEEKARKAESRAKAAEAAAAAACSEAAAATSMANEANDRADTANRRARDAEFKLQTYGVW